MRVALLLIDKRVITNFDLDLNNLELLGASEELTVNELTTEEICFNDFCLDESKLKDILKDRGISL